MRQNEREGTRAERIAKIKKRYAQQIDPSKIIVYEPTIKPKDFCDNNVFQRVAVYVRVSTGSETQTSSYELQKKYYEEFVVRHPNWELVGIYADEGISGTAYKNRTNFNLMLADCRKGKIDLIVTKSVSRFARNVVDCIGIVRDLADLKPSVGVLFEMENIFSLKDDSQMALSFQATMAQEESHVKSRSMNASYDMRFDNGMYMTPKLLGYTINEDGDLTINHEQAPTVKLIFNMYLCNYSASEIAQVLMQLGRKTLKGNTKWSSSTVLSVLRNERHCGELLTRKTWTPDYLKHRSVKNMGEKRQIRVLDHHDPIIPIDDFFAVQKMIENAKYGNKSILPDLQVIKSGFLKGYVIIHPHWSGFDENDYFQASDSTYEGECFDDSSEITVVSDAGDFDMRGFEVARSEFFDSNRRPSITISRTKVKFSSECIRKFGDKLYIEMLLHPTKKCFAIRATTKENRQSAVWAKSHMGVLQPKEIPAAAFSPTLFSMFQWNSAYRYRALGTFHQKNGEAVIVFDLSEPEVFVPEFMLSGGDAEGGSNEKPLLQSGKHIRAVPDEWTESFGREYYLQRHIDDNRVPKKDADWNVRTEGEAFPIGEERHVTDVSVMKEYIQSEILKSIPAEETNNE